MELLEIRHDRRVAKTVLAFTVLVSDQVNGVDVDISLNAIRFDNFAKRPWLVMIDMCLIPVDEFPRHDALNSVKSVGLPKVVVAFELQDICDYRLAARLLEVLRFVARINARPIAEIGFATIAANQSEHLRRLPLCVQINPNACDADPDFLCGTMMTLQKIKQKYRLVVSQQRTDIMLFNYGPDMPLDILFCSELHVVY